MSFKIGAKQVAIANAKTHEVKVYRSGKLVRTMPTSMGRGGYVDGNNGQKISASVRRKTAAFTTQSKSAPTYQLLTASRYLAVKCNILNT